MNFKLYICAFLIGIITALMGFGWFNDGEFNARGAMINIFALIILNIVLFDKGNNS